MRTSFLDLLEVKGGIKLNEYMKLKVNKKAGVTIRQTGQTQARAVEQRARQSDEAIVTLAPLQIFK